ncbi:MAG: hypothetical protein AB7M12_10395 [Hyphomonadaceae bacterium]
MPRRALARSLLRKREANLAAWRNDARNAAASAGSPGKNATAPQRGAHAAFQEPLGALEFCTLHRVARRLLTLIRRHASAWG